jgi:hypothetical protein
LETFNRQESVNLLEIPFQSGGKVEVLLRLAFAGPDFKYDRNHKLPPS